MRINSQAKSVFDHINNKFPILLTAEHFISINTKFPILLSSISQLN